MFHPLGPGGTRLNQTSEFPLFEQERGRKFRPRFPARPDKAGTGRTRGNLSSVCLLPAHGSGMDVAIILC